MNVVQVIEEEVARENKGLAALRRNTEIDGKPRSHLSARYLSFFHMVCHCPASISIT